MKSQRALFLIAALLSISFASFSQSLTFCDKADAGGKPVNANSVFTVAKNGGPVTMLFTLPAASKLTSVSFDVYKIDNGKEVFQSTLKQPVNGSQNSVSKQMIFYNEGRYRVYVFDDQDKQLSKGEVLIKK